MENGLWNRSLSSSSRTDKQEGGLLCCEAPDARPAAATKDRGTPEQSPAVTGLDRGRPNSSDACRDPRVRENACASEGHRGVEREDGSREKKGTSQGESAPSAGTPDWSTTGHAAAEHRSHLGNGSIFSPRDGDFAVPASNPLFPVPVSPSPGAAGSLLLFMRAGFLHRKTRHTRRFARRFLILDRHILFSFKSIPLKCRNVCRYTSHLLFASYALPSSLPQAGPKSEATSHASTLASRAIADCETRESHPSPQTEPVRDCDAAGSISGVPHAPEAPERSSALAAPPDPASIYGEARQDHLASERPRRRLPSLSSLRPRRSPPRKQVLCADLSRACAHSPPCCLSTERRPDAGDEGSSRAAETKTPGHGQKYLHGLGGGEETRERPGAGEPREPPAGDWGSSGNVAAEKGGADKLLSNLLSSTTSASTAWSACSSSPLAIVTDSALADLFDFSQATCAWDMRTARLSNFSYDKQQKGFTWTLHAQNILQLALETQHANRKREDEEKKSRRNRTGASASLALLHSSSSLFYGDGRIERESVSENRRPGARGRDHGTALPSEGQSTLRGSGGLHDEHFVQVHQDGREESFSQLSGEDNEVSPSNKGGLGSAVDRERRRHLLGRYAQQAVSQDAGEEEPQEERERDEAGDPGDISALHVRARPLSASLVEGCPEGEDQKSRHERIQLHRRGEKARFPFPLLEFTGEQAKQATETGLLDGTEEQDGHLSSSASRSSSSSATRGTGGEAVDDDAFRHFDEQFLMEAADGGEDLYFSGRSDLSGRSLAERADSLRRHAESGDSEREDEEGMAAARDEREEAFQPACAPSLRYVSPNSGLPSDSESAAGVAPAPAVHTPENATSAGEARASGHVAGETRDDGSGRESAIASCPASQVAAPGKRKQASVSAAPAPPPAVKSVLPDTGYFDDLDAFPPLPPPAACVETLTFYTQDAVTAHDWVAALLRCREFGSAAAVYVHWRDLQLYNNACAEGLPHWLWPFVGWVEKRECDRRRAAALQAGLSDIPRSPPRSAGSSFAATDAGAHTERRVRANEAPDAASSAPLARPERCAAFEAASSAPSPYPPPQLQPAPALSPEEGNGHEDAGVSGFLSSLRNSIASAVAPETVPSPAGLDANRPKGLPSGQRAASWCPSGPLQEASMESRPRRGRHEEDRLNVAGTGPSRASARARTLEGGDERREGGDKRNASSSHVKPYAFDPFSLLPPLSSTSCSLLSLVLHSLDVHLFPVGYTPYILVSFQSSLYPCVLIPGSPDTSVCSPFLPLPAAAVATPAASASLFQKLFSRAAPHPVPAFGPSSFVFRPSPCLNLPLFASRNQQDLVIHVYAAPPPSYSAASLSAERARQSPETFGKKRQGAPEKQRRPRDGGTDPRQSEDSATRRSAGHDPSPSLPCPPPSGQGPAATLGPFLCASQPSTASPLALSLSLACPLAYYVGSVAVPSHLFGTATPQRLSLPLLPLPASSSHAEHPLADLCRALPAAGVAGESGLSAAAREAGPSAGTPQPGAETRPAASAREGNLPGRLASTAVAGDKGREPKRLFGEGRIEISVMSPTLWPSYLQPVEEVFDTPQPFLDGSGVATGAAAAADAAGGGATWLPIQQLLLQIKRLGRLRDRVAEFVSLASAVTEFSSPCFSLFCLLYLLVPLVLLPSRFLAFLLLPPLLVVLSSHPQAGTALLHFLTEFPLFLLFTPQRQLAQLLFSPASASSAQPSRPLAFMLVLLLKHQHVSWPFAPSAASAGEGNARFPENGETSQSGSAFSLASHLPCVSCPGLGDSDGRVQAAERERSETQSPAASCSSCRFSWIACGCVSPSCSPWRLPPPLPLLLLPSYEREEGTKGLWSNCRLREHCGKLAVSFVHWFRMLLAFSVAGGAPHLSLAVAELLSEDFYFVPSTCQEGAGDAGGPGRERNEGDEQMPGAERWTGTTEKMKKASRQTGGRRGRWREDAREEEEEARQEEDKATEEEEEAREEEDEATEEEEEAREEEEEAREEEDAAREEEDEARGEDGREGGEDGTREEGGDEEARQEDERTEDGVEDGAARDRGEAVKGVVEQQASERGEARLEGLPRADGGDLGESDGVQEADTGGYGEGERDERGDDLRNEKEETPFAPEAMIAPDAEASEAQERPSLSNVACTPSPPQGDRQRADAGAGPASLSSPRRRRLVPRPFRDENKVSAPPSSSSSSSASPEAVGRSRELPAAPSGPETVFKGVALFARKWMKKHFRVHAQRPPSDGVAILPQLREGRGGEGDSAGLLAGAGGSSAGVCSAERQERRDGEEGALVFTDAFVASEERENPPQVDLFQLGSAHNYFVAPQTSPAVRPVAGRCAEPGEAHPTAETDSAGKKTEARDGREGREQRAKAEGMPFRTRGRTSAAPGKRARFRDDSAAEHSSAASAERRLCERGGAGGEEGGARARRHMRLPGVLASETGEEEPSDEERLRLSSPNTWGQTEVTASARLASPRSRGRSAGGEKGRLACGDAFTPLPRTEAGLGFPVSSSAGEKEEGTQFPPWKQRSASLSQSWGSRLISFFAPRLTPVIPKAALTRVDSPYTSALRLSSGLSGRVSWWSLRSTLAASSPFVPSQIFLPQTSPNLRGPGAPAAKRETGGLGLLGNGASVPLVLSVPPFSSPSAVAAALEALLTLLTMRRPPLDCASLFLPVLLRVVPAEAPREHAADLSPDSGVSFLSAASSSSPSLLPWALESRVGPASYSLGSSGAAPREAVQAAVGPTALSLATSPVPAEGLGGTAPVSAGDPADLETLETPLIVSGGGPSLPGGEFLALYREVRASSTRFLVKLWRWVVWGEKLCNLFSWRNRSLTEAAFFLASLSLLLLFCAPLQYLLAVWIIHAFISGQKRGLWKLLARDCARRHVEAAIYEICFSAFAHKLASARRPDSSAHQQPDATDSREEQRVDAPEDRPFGGKGGRNGATRPAAMLPLLRFLSLPELQQLRLSLWRRCGVALSLETLWEALDETELAEALRRGREETTVSASRWARTDWMTNLLLHAPTDVTHQTTAVTLRDSHAFWAGAELLPAVEETGPWSRTGPETLGATAWGDDGEAQSRAPARFEDGASDLGGPETLGDRCGRERRSSIVTIVGDALFGQGPKDPVRLESGEEPYAGQSAPMNAAVVDAVGGAFIL
ncbi:conserved hypothetical protein [Neospora caninum Liverpool]|uniref:Uncharacterized protein n=1 Tax=Neospora caninum (strain Liverpool) TaxID=572307 RepID=F0V8X2_NEOCL|nr:conserved hypothetical protein [Neospora caninum Liverpool]CBZ50163.1 conserved hypothetical protein [Neospora caninum Liverpool]CEL64758.1 TPA: hypothetical protein BN1204_006390 [Neospora caninum Liverpool]|eukprot:XP_003880198.1 conserved hypothetical protein [Neospora caninum Liverpool]